MKKIVAIGFVLISLATHAQFIFGGKNSGTFKAFGDASAYSKSQVWLGIKGGSNGSWANAAKTYQVIQPLPATSGFNYSKRYETIQFPGYQFGIVAIFNFRTFFSLGFEPGFSMQSFGYSNNYRWVQENSSTEVTLRQKIIYHLQYFDLPLYVRVDVYKGPWRPYLILGSSYSMLVRASRVAVYTSKDNATGVENFVHNPAPESGVDQSFLVSHFAYLGGLGISRDFQNIRAGLNLLFQGSYHTVTRQKNRFENDKIVASGDVLDDVLLRKVDVSLYVIFPLKFLISPGYNRVDP